MKTIDRFPGGTVRIPPSKSMAHRAVICAALAEGESELSGIAPSEDIEATLRCVTALGARHTLRGDDHIISGGLTRGGACALDCGESGSTLRFLIPIAAALKRKARFTGRGRLMSRPLGPYDAMFGENGLSADGEGLWLSGSLHSGSFRLPGHISSQFVSGLLLAMPLLDGGGEILINGTLESASYAALTIEVMERFGVTVVRDGASRFTVPAGQRYAAARYAVEADYSQAAFFLVAGALGCDVTCLGLRPDSRQGDRVMLDILTRCGAAVSTDANGGVSVAAGRLKAVTADVSDCPDLVPPLAVLLTFCEGESRIAGAARLRLKESDRLAALTSELTKLGADIHCEGDSLRIRGVKTLHGGVVQPWGDHRIAMALAVAAIRSTGDVVLRDPGVVAKSYPDFWRDFERGASPV